jgi:hypothetical protein
LRRPAKRPTPIQTDGLTPARPDFRSRTLQAPAFLGQRLTAVGHSRAFGPRFLHRGAGRLAIRTEHAAIAGLRFYHRRAGAAFVDIWAGVRRHCFGALTPASGTGDRRDQFHREHGAALSSLTGRGRRLLTGRRLVLCKLKWRRWPSPALPASVIVVEDSGAGHALSSAALRARQGDRRSASRACLGRCCW